MTTKRTEQKPVKAQRTPIAGGPSIFTFTDYREYLRSILQQRKASEKNYSLTKFAQSLGFSTHAGLAMVLSGQRELRSPYLEKCIRKLKLTPRERIHFETMVRSAHLGDRARVRLLKQVELLTSRWEMPDGADCRRLIDYLLIQQILNLYRPVPVDAATLWRHFRYEISQARIEDGLAWLREQGLVNTKDGKNWYPLKSVFMLKDEIPNVEGKQLHKDFMRLAAQVMDTDEIDRREFQTFVISVNSKRIPEIKAWIKRAAMEIASEFEDELDSDSLVQFHFNLFEVVERIRRGGESV